MAIDTLEEEGAGPIASAAIANGIVPVGRSLSSLAIPSDDKNQTMGDLVGVGERRLVGARRFYRDLQK